MFRHRTVKRSVEQLFIHFYEVLQSQKRLVFVIPKLEEAPECEDVQIFLLFLKSFWRFCT